MKKFDSTREAIFAALKDLGYRSSLQDLARHADARSNKPYPISVATACTVRKQWLIENNIPLTRKTDCRTYEGQPRRNMLNDHAISPKAFKLLTCFAKGRNGSANLDFLTDLCEECHSIDQLKEMVSELASVKKNAA